MRKNKMIILILSSFLLTGCIDKPDGLPDICPYDGTHIVPVAEDRWTCEWCHEVVFIDEEWKVVVK